MIRKPVVTTLTVLPASVFILSELVCQKQSFVRENNVNVKNSTPRSENRGRCTFLPFKCIPWQLQGNFYHTPPPESVGLCSVQLTHPAGKCTKFSPRLPDTVTADGNDLPIFHDKACALESGDIPQVYNIAHMAAHKIARIQHPHQVGNFLIDCKSLIRSDNVGHTPVMLTIDDAFRRNHNLHPFLFQAQHAALLLEQIGFMQHIRQALFEFGLQYKINVRRIIYLGSKGEIVCQVHNLASRLQGLKRFDNLNPGFLRLSQINV